MKAEPGFWQEDWRDDVLERGFEAAAGLAFVYVVDGDIIGFICGHDLPPVIIEGSWSRRGDLNPGPTDYESVALPLSYAGPG